MSLKISLKYIKKTLKLVKGKFKHLKKKLLNSFTPVIGLSFSRRNTLKNES